MLDRSIGANRGQRCYSQPRVRWLRLSGIALEPRSGATITSSFSKHSLASIWDILVRTGGGIRPSNRSLSSHLAARLCSWLKLCGTRFASSRKVLFHASYRPPPQVHAAMGIKRKASVFEESPLSPEAPSSTTPSLASSPCSSMSTHTPLHGENVPYDFWTMGGLPYLNLRTRKRFRDDRPSEEKIYENTLKKLYDAQRREEIAVVDDSMIDDADMTDEPTIMTMEPKERNQMSIESFFGKSSAKKPHEETPERHRPHEQTPVQHRPHEHQHKTPVQH